MKEKYGMYQDSRDTIFPRGDLCMNHGVPFTSSISPRPSCRGANEIAYSPKIILMIDSARRGPENPHPLNLQKGKYAFGDTAPIIGLRLC